MFFLNEDVGNISPIEPIILLNGCYYSM